MTVMEQGASTDLISEAFGAGDGDTSPERFVELDKLLREEIERLQPIVLRMADRKPAYSRDWYALVNAADAADDAMSFQLSTTPIAGSIHVAELARRLVELRRVGGIQP